MPGGDLEIPMTTAALVAPSGVDNLMTEALAKLKALGITIEGDVETEAKKILTDVGALVKSTLVALDSELDKDVGSLDAGVKVLLNAFIAARLASVPGGEVAAPVVTADADALVDATVATAKAAADNWAASMKSGS